MLSLNTLRGAVLAATICTGGLGVGMAGGGFFGDDAAAVPAARAAHSTAETCAAEEPEIGAEAFDRTELFFGTAKPDGTAVTEAEWTAFLADEITPRFPDGLTVMTGMGQWQEEDGDIIQERSQLVILLYPSEFAAESGALIEEIRAAYEQDFQQESVLRADDDAAPVCVSF